MNRIAEAANQNKVVHKEKLCANFAIENKSTRRTFLEILKELENSGYVKIENNEIYGLKVWEAEQIVREDRLNGKT